MVNIRTLGPQFAPSFHRPWLRYIDPVEGAEGGNSEPPEQTFTQADVDRLVGTARQDERRKASAKYSDYDDLKSKADGAKTLEQQFADMKTELAATKAEALRSRVAAQHGISTQKGPNGEPSDADLFLTGTTEETLAAQAERLAGRAADQKKPGPVVRREGGNRNQNGQNSDMREFARDLFGNTDE